MKQHRAVLSHLPILPWLAWLTRLALCAGALALSLVRPPLVAFRPAPLPALALSALGVLALLLPNSAIKIAVKGLRPRSRLRRLKPPLPLKAETTPEIGASRFIGRQTRSGEFIRRWGGRVFRSGLQISGFLLLCLVIGWCVLSQPIALNRPVLLEMSLRALPVVTMGGLAALLLAPHAWQRRAMVALTLPTLLALGVVAWRTLPNVIDFRPYWLAVDSHGTLYVTDVESPVIRLFSADGTLQAKLRPRQAVLKGPPGVGFSPPGPWNDPDHLGVPGLNGQKSTAYGWLRPWAPNTDEFLFCGLALDAQDRLYVLDWLGNQLLRFTPDGVLEAIWPLPSDYEPAFGCLAISGETLFVGDDRGQVLRYDLAGHLLGTQTLPGALHGLSADRSGHLYALLGNQVWRETLASQQTILWDLPQPQGALGFPYETLLALDGDQVLVSDLNTQYLWHYSGEGRLLGTLGGPGNQLGQFAGIGGLALGPNGDIYATDSDHRVVQRMTLSGTVDGLYRGPDDDEND